VPLAHIDIKYLAMHIKAILFDCDGVLVDSEPLTNAVLRDLLAESGWDMPLDECMRRFVGKAVREERAAIEQHTGQPLTDDWMARFYQRRNAALEAGLQIMAGALPAVQAAHQAAHGQIACASGADRFKVEMQLRKVGLLPFFEGRVFSGHEVARSKPAPDVYLAAAQHLAVPPAMCLVVEDSVAGVSAGVAAGATVWAFCPDAANAAALRHAGAHHLFEHMGALPALLSAVV
jgi:HAD superfamily hydrolase (TIGR01509 family)